MLIQLSRSTSTGVKYEISGCLQCEVGVTGPRVSVSVYILCRYEGGGVRLIVGGPSGIEVVVLGGHVIVGLSKKRIQPPGLATLSRFEMGVGGHVHVCMRSFSGLEQTYYSAAVCSCRSSIISSTVVAVVSVL